MTSFQLIAATLASIFADIKTQSVPCVYQGGINNEYSLNLTSISDWTISFEAPDFNYYYTPCGNREICVQGNKETASNVVQYNRDTDQCEYYLSIDHKQPAQYQFWLDAWTFNFQDGNICAQTNKPRATQIDYICDTHVKGDAWFYAAAPIWNQPCNYLLELRSPLACVPVNDLNAKCQWRWTDYSANITYNLDLSSFSNKVIYGEQNNNNTGGYLHYFSPCGNNIPCYQAQEDTQNVMAMIENTKTGTCDTYLAVWEDGRAQPYYDDQRKRWVFHYINGKKCANGNGATEVISYYCDESVDDIKVINATSWSTGCYWELNLASKLVCQNSNRGKNYFYNK
eukprot:398498_1